MAEAAERAARLTDPVCHGLGMIGMIGGAILGAAVGAFLILTAPVSAPLLAAALIGVAAAGAVAGGALAGDQLMHGLQTAFGLSDPTTGEIGKVGSPDVFIGHLPAVRVELDSATRCNGMLHHLPIPQLKSPARIAEGSATVFVNFKNLARVSSKLECGGSIKDGCATVIIGGPTYRALPVNDLEDELKEYFGDVLKVCLFAAGTITLFMGGAAILMFGVVVGGFYVANEALGALGDKLGPGWRDILQGGFGLAAIVAGAKLAPGEELPEGEPIPGEKPVPEGEPTPVEERCPCGEPVDAVTGEVFMTATDFVLPGALPIRFERAYASSLNQESWLGPNWCCSWGQSIHDSGAGVVHYFPGNGGKISFELGDADAEGWLSSPKVNKVRLRQTPRGFEVRNWENHLLRFGLLRGSDWLLTAIEDDNGNALRFHYDRGALHTVEHTGGYRLHVTATGNHIGSIALEQPDRTLATLVRYEYDNLGRLSGVDNGSGHMLRYEYDHAARIVRWADREKTWYQYRYDQHGRCVESIGPGEIYHYLYAFDTANRTTTVIDSKGAATVFQYNERKQVIAQRDPLGGFTRTEWDERGNKLSVTNPENRRVAYQYDAEGNLIGATDALGRTTKFEYSRLGLPVVLADPAARRWLRRYDQRGNLIEAGLEGSGAPWRYERDSRGNLVRIIDPSGRSRQFTYNAAGLPLTVSDWEGNITRYRRDVFGRVVREIDPLESETRFAYSPLNKLAQVVLPNGATIRWEYDAEGNLTRRTGADGAAYSYSYGPFDLRQSVTRPSGSSLRFHYDNEARLVAVENEKGELWKYSYDLAGRVVEEQDFTGRVQRFEYDRSGLCVKRINGKGEAIEIERNPVGQIVRRKAADDSETSFEYDINGLVAEASNPWITVRFERDEYGRVLREIQGERVVESSYDERGLRTRRRTSSGNMTKETTWSYDANGRVERVGLAEDEWLEFTRDAVGHDVERRLTQGEKRGGFVLRQDYDPVHRLVSQWAGLGAASPAVTAIAERQYRYDLNDNPTEIYDRHWGTSRFRYDADGRIAGVTRESGVVDEFRYDPSGNIKAVESNGLRLGAERIRSFEFVEERMLGPGGRLERAGGKQYIYDEDGRVIEKRDGERIWKYEWTTEGHLRSVITPKGETWKYEYDAFGRRVRKIGPQETITYLWDGGVVAEEIRETRNSSTTASWFFEPGTFRPVAKVENGKSYACVTDQIGTPRELVSANGEVAWSAQFTTWGEIEALQADETDCPIRFQGQWYDEESGLHYNWNRYYEVETGGYLSPDPAGLSGGSREYGYVHNPLSWVDPLGLASCSAKYEYDARANRYRSTETGRFASQRDLPWPSNRGFAGSSMQDVPEGTILDRYGRLSGRYMGEPGATISERGMVPGSQDLPYSQFEVVKPFPAEVGPAAPVPDFGASGGATQYLPSQSVADLVKGGFLKPIK